SVARGRLCPHRTAAGQCDIRRPRRNRCRPLGRIPRSPTAAGTGCRRRFRPIGAVAARRRLRGRLRRTHLRCRPHHGRTRMSAAANTAEPASVTDVHAHLLLPQLLEAVRQRAPEQMESADALELIRNGAESMQASGAMIGQRFPKLTQLDVRLADMDDQGVDVQWVSPSPSHYYPWADEDLAV